MAIVNPIQYTSRTFNTILNDINSDPLLKDTPDWYKRIWAGVGDMLSIIENVSANQSFLRTSFTRQAVMDLLQLIDYTLTPQSTCSGNILFYLASGTLGQTYGTAVLKAQSQGTVSIPAKRFESRLAYTYTVNTPVFTYSGTGSNFTIVSYDFVTTGHKVRLTTTGALPTGLSLNTDYYIIYTNSTTVKLASSLSNAYAGVYITPSGAGSGTHTMTVLSFLQNVYQQETKTTQIIGNSDGSTQWQEFTIPDTFLLPDTLTVQDSGLSTYAKVTTFVNSLASDKVYKVIPKDNNSFSIQFGNGTYGYIPPSGAITVSYAVGGGSASNINVIGNISLYSGGDNTITGVSNPTIITGGSDQQSIEQAKVLAPLLLKTRDTFVTNSDGVTLALNYGGLSAVTILSNFYGVNSCKVIAVATGGGNPSGALKSSIQAYLISKSVLSSVDIRFVDATFTSVTLTTNVNLISGYLWANVLPYLTIAYKLFFTDTGAQIKNSYLQQDSTTAITLLNSIFLTSFDTADGQIISLIKNLNPIYFGAAIYLSEIESYVQSNVLGVNYLTVSSPSLPLVLSQDQITTHTGSTFTINQV